MSKTPKGVSSAGDKSPDVKRPARKPVAKAVAMKPAAKADPVTAATTTKPAKSPTAKRKATPKAGPAAKPAASTKPVPEPGPALPPPGAQASGHTGGGAEAAKPDIDALSRNMTRLVEESGKAIAAYMKPLESGKANPDMAEHVGDAVKTLGHVAERWLADPKKTLEAQTALSSSFLSLWSQTLRRLGGEEAPPVVPADKRDKRFADPEWTSSPLFDFLRQAYSIATNWASDMVERAEGLDPLEKQKAEFYVRQISGALSPSNFVATNPELLRETMKQNGENLVRGMHMLVEDIEAGKGQVKIRQSDSSKLVIGVDMANTPGKVVFRNDLMELIQYAPTTEQVFRRPLLIVPPWINKFYVLDLNREKSFVRWCVAQGLTVFVVSWVNPDERHANKGFEAYMHEGILAAVDAIEQATGEKKVAAMGYCVGGTLLAITLAWMAAKNDARIDAVTFLTTQVDFENAGDLKVFVDAERIAGIEQKMAETGYLEGSKMATAFNMLRPNELIWSYVVNNYLKGKEPMPFDLLSWNSDSTRMPAANHSFYLRNCYLENNITKGTLVIDGEKVRLGDVKTPVYNLAAKEDHIAPALSVFNGSKFFGGPMRYVLAGSGHIAGVVNPADKPKYQYWTGPRPAGEFDEWVKSAVEHPGSWWVDWIAWMAAQAPDKVPARIPGDGKLKPVCDAPGEYVLVKA